MSVDVSFADTNCDSNRAIIAIGIVAVVAWFLFNLFLYHHRFFFIPTILLWTAFHGLSITIPPGVCNKTKMMPLPINAKPDNWVHPADGHPTVSSKLIWIHRMLFVADPHKTTESVNSDYCVQFLLSSIQCGSTCKTNLHAAVHIFLLSFYWSKRWLLWPK